MRPASSRTSHPSARWGDPGGSREPRTWRRCPRRTLSGSASSTYPKAPCSFIVNTWAVKGLPYHDFGGYVYTVKLHGAFGIGTWELL